MSVPSVQQQQALSTEVSAEHKLLAKTALLLFPQRFCCPNSKSQLETAESISTEKLRGMITQAAQASLDLNKMPKVFDNSFAVRTKAFVGATLIAGGAVAVGFAAKMGLTTQRDASVCPPAAANNNGTVVNGTDAFPVNGTVVNGTDAFPVNGTAVNGTMNTTAAGVIDFACRTIRANYLNPLALSLAIGGGAAVTAGTYCAASAVVQQRNADANEMFMSIRNSLETKAAAASV